MDTPISTLSSPSRAQPASPSTSQAAPAAASPAPVALARPEGLPAHQPPPAPPLPPAQAARPPRGLPSAAVPSGPQHDEARKARAKRLHDEKLPSRDLALAGYLAARALDGRKVDEQDVHRLRAAQDSLEEARQRLPHGRGNVRPDLKATDWRNLDRVNTARNLAKKLEAEQPTTATQAEYFRAASVSAFGVGCCGEYATLGLFMHADKLVPGEMAYKVRHATIDHSWVESRLIGTERDRTVIIDPWGEGPPVLATDGAFTTSEEDIKDLKSMPLFAPSDRVRRNLAAVEERIHTRFSESELQAMLPPALPTWLRFNGGIFSPTPVIDEEFSDRVRPRIEAGGLSVEIAMAGAARALGQPIHTLAADVPAIRDVALQVLP
jgi:hypothetical protein